MLKISGPTKDIRAFKEQAVGFSPWFEPEPDESPEAFNFHSLVPVPQHILDAGYSSAGYNWQIEHWGCKWSASKSVLKECRSDSLCYWFETPWSPPLPFIEQVSKNWPTLLFVLSFADEILNYSGRATAQAGTLNAEATPYPE